MCRGREVHIAVFLEDGILVADDDAVVVRTVFSWGELEHVTRVQERVRGHQVRVGVKVWCVLSRFSED